MYENLRKKTRLDSDEVTFSTKDGELELIPRYKRDKNFPKSTIMKWQEKNMDNSIKDLRKRLNLS